MIPWWRIAFGEEEIAKVADSIRGEHISQGAVTEKLEHEIAQRLGVPYVVGVTNGSIALLMSLIASDVKPGDEVIIPNRTWIATAHAAALIGAKVVLVDVETDRPIIDVSKIEENITSRTKVIMPVHLNGRSAHMQEIQALALKYNLSIVEDAAQAFFSRNANGFLGTQSNIGCFSMAISKIISTGQGGFMAVHTKEMCDKLKLIRIHGTSDVVNASWTRLGFNFRLTDLHAALGLVQLDRLKSNIDSVNSIYSLYLEGLSDLDYIELIPVNREAGEIPVYIEVLVPERERFIEYLADRGIQTRPFYPDLDTAHYFENTGKYPNARRFGSQGVFLPCGPAQSSDNIHRTIEQVRKYKL